MKKQLLLALCGLTVPFALSAQVGVLIDSFEESTLFDPQGAVSAAFSSTTGVTEGDFSWALTNQSDGYNAAFETFNISALSLALDGATAISLDVFPEVANPDAFFGIALDLNSTGGFIQLGQVFVGVNSQSTMTWELTQPALDAIAATIADDSGSAFMGLQFYTNAGGGFGTGDTFYIDNLVAIPEPRVYAVVLGLLGLAFAVYRRRRQR